MKIYSSIYIFVYIYTHDKKYIYLQVLTIAYAKYILLGHQKKNADTNDYLTRVVLSLN